MFIFTNSDVKFTYYLVETNLNVTAKPQCLQTKELTCLKYLTKCQGLEEYCCESEVPAYSNSLKRTASLDLINDKSLAGALARIAFRKVRIAVRRHRQSAVVVPLI